MPGARRRAPTAASILSPLIGKCNLNRGFHLLIGGRHRAVLGRFGVGKPRRQPHRGAYSRRDRGPYNRRRSARFAGDLAEHEGRACEYDSCRQPPEDTESFHRWGRDHTSLSSRFQLPEFPAFAPGNTPGPRGPRRMAEVQDERTGRQATRSRQTLVEPASRSSAGGATSRVQ
jgi:hypothetical protein